MDELQVLLLLVLAIGVGLGSAVTAWATRLSGDEALWLELGKSTFPDGTSMFHSDSTTSSSGEPPQTS